VEPEKEKKKERKKEEKKEREKKGGGLLLIALSAAALLLYSSCKVATRCSLLVTRYSLLSWLAGKGTLLKSNFSNFQIFQSQSSPQSFRKKTFKL